MSNYLSPDQILEYTVDTGVKKSGSRLTKSFLLAFMGGIFIALAAIGSIIATCTIKNYSVAAIVGGIIFSIGLMMVVVAGGDLFTGNVLIITSVMSRKTKPIRMIFNLFVAFLGNLTGAVFIAILVNYSNMLTNGNGAVIQSLMVKAVHKMEYPFHQAFILGIMCNLLVCLAVWMMYSAKDIAGRLLAGLFPITLFILSGYEHIVANMYYLPAALLAKTSGEFIKLSGLSNEAISHITLEGLAGNFIPVLLGNLVGGLIIGTVYSIIYRKRAQDMINNDNKLSI